MDELQQEQFTKALLGLVDLAKTKKNILQYGEINDAFKGLELTEDKMVLAHVLDNGWEAWFWCFKVKK